MVMPERKFSASSSYRYGFNGKENDNEVKGEGHQQDYGMRIYDTRLGRFLSVDPLMKEFSYYTPYQFASNSPLLAIDIDGLESSNDPNPTSQTTDPNQVKKYDASTWWSPLTKVFPSTGVVEHSHVNDINTIYSKSGGDEKFNSNGAGSVINFMNENLTPTKPGSIILNPNSPQATTDLSSAFYSSKEKGSEKAWINLMLGGMIKGTVPENIVFTPNGTVSSFLINSPAYDNLLEQWYDLGKPNGDNSIYGFDYNERSQGSDIIMNFSFFSMSNFVGSCAATVLANPEEKTITLTITNVSSVHSGDYMKHMWWHNDTPPFLHRNPENSSPQPYTNFSQTYQLILNYEDVIKRVESNKRFSSYLANPN